MPIGPRSQSTSWLSGAIDMSHTGQLTYRAALALRGESRVFSYLRELRRLERLTSQDIATYQENRLRRLLQHTVDQVPYYRSLKSKLAFDPSTSALDQLGSWPITEKDDIRGNATDRLAETRGRAHIKSTGGSTGLPVRLLKDANGIAWERAATWLGLGWFGIKFGDRAARLWGSPISTQARRSARLADIAMNRVTFSVFDIDDANLEHIWNSLIRTKPTWIYGYADALHRLGTWRDKSGHDAAELRTGLIVSTGEPISAEVEEAISLSLQAPVQNEYGCGEVGAIAYGCPSGSLHIMAGNVLVEILRPDGTCANEGEMGEVVVTDLSNHTQPLIRYRLGDRSSLLPACSCGLPWPRIDRVEGRAMDLILTPKGRKIYGAFITYHMRRFSDDGHRFQQYQFIQRTESTVELRLRASETLSQAFLNEISEFARTHLDGMQIQVVRVEEIKRERSGKLRIVKSDLPPARLA